MSMKKLLLLAAGIAVVAGGAFALSQHSAAPAAPAEAPYTVPPLTKSYSNDSYNFSLKMPESFDATKFGGDQGGTTIVLQDKENNGIQIVVTPFDEDTGGGYLLTEERIKQDVPDLRMSEAQPLEVGSNYTGLAFKSDNAAFGGASREVWFVFRGNLYQISTYARLDDLLKQIFATWQFS